MSIVMGSFGFYMVTTLMSVMVLVNILEVDSASNLEVNGNQVSGQSFRLECNTSTINTRNYGAFYRSTDSRHLGARVGYRAFDPDLTQSCIKGTVRTHYTVSCNSDGSVFTLTISANNTIEHKTYWRCQTNIDNRVLENNVIHMFIIVPITGISLIRPPLATNNTVIVTTDQTITFKCQTSQGRPAAYVTWYLDNARLSGGTSTTTPVSGDIVITTGSLTLTLLNRTADNKVLSCRATNYVNMEPVESAEKPVIRVKYAPSGPPVIVGYSNGTVYRTILGHPQSVTCQGPTSLPVPTLSWSCPSYTVTGTTLLPVSTDVVSSSITWTIKSTEPGQTCQCTSYQEVSGHVTTYVTIDVLYPPRIMGHDAIVVEYSTATLRCSAEGVPTTYTFYNWTHVAPDHVTVLRSLPGIYMSTTTTLTLSDVNYQDTGYYRCNVSNGIQDYITATSSTSFDVNLTVRSRPIVTRRQKTPGRKGYNITLSVEFYSNSASPPNMIWYHAGEYPPRYISGSRFETSLTTSTVDLHMYGHTVQLPGFTTSLTVKNSEESDFTIYTCVAVNDVGTTSVDIALVQEGQTESSQEGPITGPIIGALLGGTAIGVLVVLGILCLRGHWLDKGPKEDKTQSSTENQLSTGDQGIPVYTNLELTVTPHVEQGQQYQDLTPNRSATTSEYQTLDIRDTVVPDLDS